jgi:hypothetical protein
MTRSEKAATGGDLPRAVMVGIYPGVSRSGVGCGGGVGFLGAH